MWKNSVFLIDSQDPGNDNFGSGFVIYSSNTFTYLLTCSHVVIDVGGKDQVRVANLPAIIIVQSDESNVADLAVLKVDGLLGAEVLPIGIFGRKDSCFEAWGYRVYEKKQRIVKCEPAYGHLRDITILQRQGYQGSSDVWDLQLDDEFILRKGFSGSPVIDCKSRMVTGVIRYAEDQGRKGLATSVESLRDLWVDPPSNLFRDTSYDLDVIERSLISSFNEEGFKSFCKTYFNYDVDIKYSFSIRVNMFVLYCHRNDLCGKLMEYRKIIYLYKYYQYIISLVMLVQKFKRNRMLIKNKTEEILIRVETAVKETDILTLRNAIADIARTNREKVQIVEILEGSLFLRIRIESDALERLMGQYSNDSTLELLGFRYIESTSGELRTDNVRNMLRVSFTREAILTLCQQEYESILEQMHPESQKTEIIEKLVDYARQEARIPELLVNAFKHDARAYDRYRPYFESRRAAAPQPRVLASFVANLMQWVFATAMGLGTAIAGATVVFLVASLPIIGDVISVFPPGVVLAPLGFLIGDVLLKSARTRDRNKLGVLAIICYIVGYFLGPICALFIRRSDLLLYWYQMIPGFLMWQILIHFDLFANPLRAGVNGLAFIAGGYIAYNRVR